MRKLIVVSIIIIFILISCSSLLYFEYIEKEYHPDYEKIIFEIDAGEDQIGYSNISVRFNVSISEENHAYDYYSWDFNGDGIEEENKSFTSIIPTLLCCSHYNYTKIGIYYATVKLADTHGLIAEDTCMVTIFPFELRFEISMTNSTFKSTESILVNSSLFNSHEYLTVKIEEMWIERGSLNYHITTQDDKVFFFRGDQVYKK